METKRVADGLAMPRSAHGSNEIGTENNPLGNSDICWNTYRAMGGEKFILILKNLKK